MSFIWRFSPEEQRTSERKAYVPFVKKQPEIWVAPEHAKVAASMKKDYPRDDRGIPLPGMKKTLVVDNRPNIMVPQRPVKRRF